MGDFTLTPIKVFSETPTAPVLSDLTEEALAGEGTFDTLMRTVKLHLEEEFDSNRIVGKEYATVYLGAMTAVLAQSVAYLTSASQIDQINAGIALIRQQVVTELAKTDDVIPTDLAFNSSTSVLGMMEQEKLTAVANIAKLEADTSNQNLVTVSQIEVNDQQIIKSIADVTDQHTKVTAESTLMDGQKAKLITDASDQADKTVSDIDVNDHQILKITADITDQDRKVTSDLTVNVANIDKMDGEVLLLGQRTISELAKTCDTLPLKDPLLVTANPWLNSNANVQGSMAKQDALYAAQTEGFARDAEQKLAKIMVDTWSVRKGADPDGTESATAGLANADVDAVLDIAKAGIA